MITVTTRQHDLTQAALSLADYAARLHGRRDTCLLVHRGDDPLWRMMVGTLHTRGFPVERVQLDEHDKRWHPAELWERSGAGLLVHHDPFGAGVGSIGSATSELAALTEAGVSCLFVDFPHGLPESLLAAATGVYYRMLGYPAEDLPSLCVRWRQVLADADRIEVVVDGAVLAIRPPWTVHSDWTAVRAKPIIQAPFGQLWVVCDPAQVSGESVVQLGGGRRAGLRVRDGEVTVDGTAVPGGLVELGFGANPLALDVAGDTIAEKRLGQVHLGFGDSVFIGGDTSGPVHSGVLLPRTAEVRAMVGDQAVPLRIEGHNGQPPNSSATVTPCASANTVRATSGW